MCHTYIVYSFHGCSQGYFCSGAAPAMSKQLNCRVRDQNMSVAHYKMTQNHYCQQLLIIFIKCVLCIYCELQVCLLFILIGAHLCVIDVVVLSVDILLWWHLPLSMENIRVSMCLWVETNEFSVFCVHLNKICEWWHIFNCVDPMGKVYVLYDREFDVWKVDI